MRAMGTALSKKLPTDQEGAGETGAVVSVEKAMCPPGLAPLVSVNCLKSKKGL